MNSNELRAALARANVTNRSVSAELGISEQAFYNKLNGKTEFKNSEIIKISELLHLGRDAVDAIFFASMVNEIHTEEEPE